MAEAAPRGVITYSSGNHGQAVAFAARRFGLRAVVVMPESAPRVKVEGVKRQGGRGRLRRRHRSAEQAARAEAIARDEGLAMVPPFDHPDVIAGQGTCGLEILEQRPDVETILVPVGGGGLIAGIAAAVAALAPGVQVIGVEPVGAAKLSAALAAGEPTTLELTASMADGLLSRSVGELPFADPAARSFARPCRSPRTRSRPPSAISTTNSELRPEPSGAVATAALLAGRVERDGPAVAVVSGGNVDPDLYQRLVG